MTRSLILGPTLQLPLEAVTQTFGILAVRGAGKSNVGAVMAEEMFAAGLPFVAVDPVGSWWGLRAKGEGTAAREGLPIPIFGGRHGDVPLERTGGAMLADLIVETRLSCVLDISEFSEGDKTRFLIDFAERLYRKNTEPLHLFLEEADDYAPQRPFREQARLLGAWENVVRRGRARGLGITMITQRSAALNKNVLTQIETLFVLRTTSPQDRKAIAAWVEYHGQADELLESLQGLENGEAWVWSPQWLGKLQRARIRRRATHDSGATPKGSAAGSRRVSTLADVDLGAVRKQMAATIERAKAEDPRELRKRITELELALKAQPVAAAPKIKRVEVPTIPGAKLVRLDVTLSALAFKVDVLSEKVNAAADMVKEWRQLHEAKVATFVRETTTIIPSTPALPQRVPQSGPGTSSAGTRAPASTNGRSEEIGRGGLARMMTALAQRPQLSAEQLGIRAGMSSRSGTFDTYLGRARRAGWIEGQRSALRITDAGRRALGSYEPLPEGRELLDYWLSELGSSGAARMLKAAADAYPRTLTRSELADRSGMTGNSGTFDTYLGRLRRLELIEGRGELKASEELFG